MLALIADALDELKDAFVPTLAKAENDVCTGGFGERSSECINIGKKKRKKKKREEEDEDDEDEEEGGDPLDVIRSSCEETPACVPHVHHYAECVERVTKEQEEEGYEDKDYKEDCVEEFFHLQHCVNDCTAPRLFYKLK
ncbi:unnamed protein product [Wickerhamomyces anomalus]